MPTWIGIALPFVVFLGFFALLRSRAAKAQPRGRPLSPQQRRARLLLVVGELIAILLIAAISVLWIQLVLLAVVVAMPFVVLRVAF